MTKKQIFEAVFLVLTAVLAVAKAVSEAAEVLELNGYLEDSGN